MKRREFITPFGGAAAAWPLPLRVQHSPKVPRIGFLRFGYASAQGDRVEALLAGLRQLGYVDGKNIIIEFRWAETVEQLRELAAELVGMNVDVVFAMSSTEVEAARQATKTIPIVFAVHAEPVGVGHVASLARPGGNITGLTVLLTDLVAKEMEILKEALPQATRIGVISSSTAPSHIPALRAIEAAAAKLGVEIEAVPVRSVEDLDGAFARMDRARVDGFLVVASSLTFSARGLLAELALKHRLPGMFGTKDDVVAGGFMSYAPDHRDLTRRSAIYIDKILRGAKASDLPVEQASKYQLVINLKTAQTLGIDVSPTLLGRADEVIE
jgi:putative tryptophan/tyrosine transport system substrate-binding protein